MGPLVFWGLLAALFAVAIGCGGYLASGEVVYASSAPPPERVEVIGPAPGPGYVWMDGYWRWGGSSYDWTPGRWVVVEQGQRWHHGRWHHNRNGWFYEEGHWRSIRRSTESYLRAPIAVVGFT